MPSPSGAASVTQTGLTDHVRGLFLGEVELSAEYAGDRLGGTLEQQQRGRDHLRLVLTDRRADVTAGRGLRVLVHVATLPDPEGSDAGFATRSLPPRRPNCRQEVNASPTTEHRWFKHYRADVINA
jgi:hypothetical protein